MTKRGIHLIRSLMSHDFHIGRNGPTYSTSARLRNICYSLYSGECFRMTSRKLVNVTGCKTRTSMLAAIIKFLMYCCHLNVIQ